MCTDTTTPNQEQESGYRDQLRFRTKRLSQRREIKREEVFMKLALAALLLVTPVASAEEWKRELSNYNDPAFNQQAGYSTERRCVRQEYREEYIPGTANSPGYVRSWHEQVEIPCSNHRHSYRRSTIIERDSNDCTDGKVAGGILGGAAGAALSQGDGRWWRRGRLG